MVDPKVEIATKAKFLCNLCDSVSIGNKGDPSVLSVFEKCGYANCYVERTATKKAIPGTVQIKGDGKKNRYVINMFVQFYPGPPKYANDNISTRIEWLSQCLDKLIETTDLESLAFPSKMGVYDSNDYGERYLTVLDDFQKKYFLKHHQLIHLVDYQDQELKTHKADAKKPTYDTPIQVLKLSDLDEMSEESPQTFNVIQHIDIEDLVYVGAGGGGGARPHSPPASVPTPTGGSAGGGARPHSPPASILTPAITEKIKMKMIVKPVGGSARPSTVPVPVPVPVPAPVPVSAPVPAPVPVSAPVPDDAGGRAPPVPLPIYEKNPTWKRTITELTEELDSSWKPIFNDPKITTLLTQLDQKFEKELKIFGDFIEILPTPKT